MPSQQQSLTAAQLAAEAAKIGLAIPRICLPRTDVDLFRWPVIACDQFTAEPEYWQETAAIVGSSPSTLHMILPELYLERPEGLPVDERVRRINRNMQDYLRNGTLRTLPEGWILVDRATTRHPSRKGLVVAIDLERYDFQPGNTEWIRATEGTVIERIPPRLAIRQDAPLELPHVQLLIDDPERHVIENLYEALKYGECLYETRLMQQGGAIRAWFADAASVSFADALKSLAGLASLRELGFLAAVGDGNHSLATAKVHWDRIKAGARPDHPARHALVELINIHDEGLVFEPIHRIMEGIAPGHFLAEAQKWFAGQDLEIIEDNGSQGELFRQNADPDQTRHTLPLFWRSSAWLLRINQPDHCLAAGSLQPFLDSLVQRGLGRIDYIHGDDVVKKLARAGALGLLLPALDKRTFFQTIAREGILPRKTFSMGEAREKRYYFESRRII